MEGRQVGRQEENVVEARNQEMRSWGLICGGWGGGGEGVYVGVHVG